MSVAIPKPDIRRKITMAVESGYLCSKCGFQSVVFDCCAPKHCFNCATKHPKLVWKNKITNNVLVEVLKV